MKKMNSLLVNKGFQTSKCKTQLRLGTARIKLLRNKKGEQIVSGKKEVADLLRNGQENNARLRVQGVIREQDLIEAYDLLNLYAEQIAAQLSVIESQKTCPPDLKEDISTLLYASSRCAELTDFSQIHPMFVAKYGKEFVSAAIELRPGCGVSAKVVEKLSSNDSTGEKKVKLMKEIAKEHNVDWDPAQFEREIRGDQDDVLPGPRADTLSILVDDFPSVPNQKPTLGTYVSQSENATNPISGRFDKAEPTNSPRPGDYRTDSSGALTRTGPPSRKPPGRDQSSSEGLTSDERHPDIDPGSKETQPRRNQRRESDSFLAPSPQGRHEVQESRRNSIGVPREKSVRAHAGSAHAGVDKSSLQDHKTNNLRDAGAEDFDEAGHRKGRHEIQDLRRNSIGVPRAKSVRAHTGSAHAGVDESSLQDHQASNLRDAGAEDFDETGHRKGNQGREYESESNGRQSQRFGGKEVSEKRKPQYQDQNANDDNVRGPPKREGFGKGRPHHEDQYPEDDSVRGPPKREGSGKGRSQHQDQFEDEENARGPPKREGSGKGRSQHQDQFEDEENARGPPKREGSGKGRSQHQDQFEDEENVRGPPKREGSGKGRSQHQDQFEDEENARGPPKREGSGKGRSQHQDQFEDEENARGPPKREGSGKGRSQHQDQFEEEENVRGPPKREGSGKGRSQHQDQFEEEENVRGPPKREGSGKGRSQHQDQFEEEENVRGPPKREGSGKGRSQHQDQFEEEENARGPPKREGSGKGRSQHQDQFEEEENVRGPPKREGSGKGRSQHQDQFEDEENARGPPKREGSGKGRSQHQDQFEEEENVRGPPKREGSGKGRSQHQDQFEEEDKFRRPSIRESSRTARPQHRDQYVDEEKVRKPSKREGSETGRPQHENQYADEEKVRKPLNRDQYVDEEKVRKPLNRESFETGRPQHRDQYADEEKVRGPAKREGSGTERPQHRDQYADDEKDRKPSNREDFGKGRPQHEDRRATIGPEEIRHTRPWETEDSPRSRFGEREKQVESRRQSAPLPKEDVIEGRVSQRDKTERGRNADIPAVYVVDRPSRFGPQVSVQKDDEYAPSTRASRDRFDGQRKVEIPARYDDGRPPPRFIKAGTQPNLEDEDVRASTTFNGGKPQRFVTSNDPSTPRPRSNLESAKTDPALSGTPKISSVPEHRKTHSAFIESASKPSTPRLQKPSPEDTHSPRQAGQPSPKLPFMAPPDLDSLIQMFGKKNVKK